MIILRDLLRFCACCVDSLILVAVRTALDTDHQYRHCPNWIEGDNEILEIHPTHRIGWGYSMLQTLVIGLGDSSAGLLPALDAARRSAEGRPLFADRPVVACDIRATAAPDVLLA